MSQPPDSRGDLLPGEGSWREDPSKENINDESTALRESGPPPLTDDASINKMMASSDRRSHQENPERCKVSLQRSMGLPLDFKSGLDSLEERVDHQSSELLSGQQQPLDLDSTRLLLKEKLDGYVQKELDRVWSYLQSPDELPKEDGEQKRSIREAFLEITVQLLRDMGEEDLAKFLWSRSCAAECRSRLKRRLKKKFHSVFEGVAIAGNSVPLSQIFTELYITEGCTDKVNQEHEAQQLETAARKVSRPEKTIRQDDLFRTPPDTDRPIRSLLTKGVAGIGKTLLTQKLTLDWAEDKAHHNFHFIFPFTFRELNLLREKKMSLVELVHLFFPETKDSGLSNVEEVQVLFILDGLDECRLPLDFNSRVLTEATESSSVDVLLTNLIRGNLLPSAAVWVTTRPAAASRIPPECVDMVTEVRGFTDLQKEAYFRKRFRDEEHTTIISHIRSSRSLYIMCHIPIFCWITATVLEDMLKSRETGELPKTLTEMYIHFLVVQAKVKKLKYDGGDGTDTVWDSESRKTIMSLGKLAFEQLQIGNLIFYESDLTECGIDIRTALLYAGMFTPIFRQEAGLYQDSVFCFVHRSLQEFMAALHVHQTFTNSGANLLQTEHEPWWSRIFAFNRERRFYQTAVDQTLKSPDGNLDLFLRFLLGLSLQSNQSLLRGLLTQTATDSLTNKETSAFIKERISKNMSPERTINLFHCLNELKDGSLVEDVQRQLRSGGLSASMSPAQWSAVAFILLSSEDHLDVFDLNKYCASEEAFLRLLPVIRDSNKVLLRGCGLSERGCDLLSSVLSSPSLSVTLLDLSDNDLRESGVELLCAGLGSPHCHLETLRSVLLHDRTVLLVVTLMEGCVLDFSLSGCLISEEGCASLASALKANPSHLRELDLSYNNPGGPGLRLLSAGRESPDWRLDTLRVDHGGEQRLRPGPRKYYLPLTLDPNTAHQRLLLSNNHRTVEIVTEEQNYPEHPDRFEHYRQLMCTNDLTGRCYYEVEWRGGVDITVAYKRTRREDECLFGVNDKSWSLICSDEGYQVRHDKTRTKIQSETGSKRVGVFVNCPTGSVSFYSVSCDHLIHLHTFYTSFSGPVYPGFGFWSWYGSGSSVTLCEPTGFAAV
ncbi:LOW QUALITY PROTEIN: protein NLRC3-like [Neosynchiropus ocellatus]